MLFSYENNVNFDIILVRNAFTWQYLVSFRISHSRVYVYVLGIK